MKYKYLLSNGAQSMRDVMGYFRRAAKQADSSLARAVTDEREFIFEPLRILYMLYASGGKGWAPPVFRPEGLSDTSGALRTLSRMVKDAARVETPFRRLYDACYVYLLKCNMPLSEGKVVPPNAPKSPQSRQQAPSDQSKDEGTSSKRPESNVEARTSEYRPRRNRSPRGNRKFRGSRRAPRRSRSRQGPVTSCPADALAKRVRYERRSAWMAGEDSKGSPPDQ